ncbi:MAG: DUF4347 domain-containing protein, partial [Magnetococcales bacterium]|nr:DUF4347 domain-containing protein [Magnetococcales bacterium]
MFKDRQTEKKNRAGHALRALIQGSTANRRVNPIRPRLLHVEAMEPRFLLSGEGLMLPPTPSPDEGLEAPLNQTVSDPLSTRSVAALHQNEQIDSRQTAAQTEGANEIIFIDPSVKNHESLIAAALKARSGQTEPGRVEVVVLDSTRDGVEQMTTWLDGYKDLQAVHVLSHGDIAALRLGITTLNQANLDDYREQLAAWNVAMAPGADLLFYGCDIAAGTEGRAFVEQLGQLTGVDVAASIDATGATEQGGDWLLEQATGSIETQPLKLDAYDQLLAVVTPTQAGSTTATISSTAPFDAAARFGLQLNASSELSYTLPMVDLTFGGLIKTNDGRSLGDLLSFKTTANTTVLDDYLATSGSHTSGGLMSRLGDYLNGIGAYSHLESWVDHAAGAPSISFNYDSGTDSLNVNLTLSREFTQRFGFDKQLKALGFDFQADQGIPLVADIHYNANYNFADGTIEVVTLDAQVQAKSATLNTEAVLGILDVTATGTMAFDTGKVEFAAVAAKGVADIKDPGDSTFASADNVIAIKAATTHNVKGNVHFDLTGTVGTTALSVLAGGTPHVDVVFGNGTTAVPWTSILSTPLTVTSTNFSQLQAFSSLNSTQLVNMLQDLGTYLELLRDSGRFDALMPFTELKLGQALDFSNTINDVIDNQLATTLVEGLTASKAISPVLTPMFTGNAAFDLYVQRPGDERISTITIAVDQIETLGFRHINQLAELLGQKIATAVNGWLAWSGSMFEIEESLKGGQTIVGSDKSSEEQTLKIHAAKGSYQLKLGAGGTLTGAIPVLASPIEVQNALESVLGAGNVVVTGRPKHLHIEFTGTLAETDNQSLVVVPGSDVVAGSLIDVSASEFSRGSDGTTWGKLNLVQAEPGTFTIMRVAPSSTVKVKQITPGDDNSESIQRLTIVHGGGSSFYLKGKRADNSDFTTAAIAANAVTTTSVANALSAVLPGVTGLSVTDVSIDYAADNGTKVFDIGFGKKDPINYGAYALMTVDTTTAGTWTSSVPAQAILATQQQAAAAAGATPAKNEIQRMSIDNATGGQYSFGVTLGTLFFQSDPITMGSGAATIQTALVNMFKQGNPDFSTNDVSVTAVAGMANSFDIEFKGIWATKDAPHLRLNTSQLTSAAGGAYGPLTRFGFMAEGQDSAVNKVTTFVTFNDMMDRFQHAINQTLPSGTTFSVNPSYDAASKSIMFNVKLAPDATVNAVPLIFSSNVGDLSALSTDTTLDLSTQTSFQSTIGFDFDNLNTFALRAAGAYTGTITANAASPGAFTLTAVFPFGADAVFNLAFDGEGYDLTVAAAATTTNTTQNDLIADFQAVLDAKTVVAGGLLSRLGYANLGELVTMGKNASNQLQFTINAALSNIKLTPSPLSSMAGILGFKTLTAYPAPKLVTLPSNGRLSATATFKLKVDQTSPVTVTVAADAGNTKTSDLVDDLNTAFAATSVAGHSYLGSSRGFANLGEVVKAILRNGQIEIATLTSKIASLQMVIDGTDPATTELGFTPGQFANTTGAYVFLQNPTIGGNYSAVVHGQNGATPATLATPGRATLGMLDLTFGTLGADYQGSMTFDLRNGLAGVAGDRISLNALFDSASSQESLLGMGGSLQTSGSVSATGVPFQSNGELLRDVGLKVTVGSLDLDVMVARSATLNNTSVTDLAADVDAAIHAALVAELGSDPYVAHTFVTITNTGTAGAPKNVLTFTAPTTTLTLAANPTQIYNATTGVLLTDLKLSVAVGGLAQPVDVIVRTSRAATNTSLADLVSDVSEAIKSALNSAKNNTSDTTVRANIDTLMAATDLVGQSGGLLTLKAGVVSAKEITLKNLVVKGRLLEGDFVTDLVFRNQAGTVGTVPTAKLELAGIGILTPTGVTASGLNAVTRITIDISNTVAALGGSTPMTAIVVVPSDGLGNLTPFKDVTWSGIRTDLGRLGSLLGKWGDLGAFGELGRALPMLGTSVSDLFDFSSRFKNIQTEFDARDGIGLQGLKSILAAGFGMDESAITLSNDTTAGQEALRITVPYRVVLNQSVALDMIFNDSALLDLLSDAAKAQLAGLIGALRELKDTEGTAKAQLYADMTFNLALGIDLASASPNKGKLFLYDHVAGGAAGFTGDTGTFARLDAFSASAAGMTFDSNQGIYSLGVTGGTASLTLNGTSGLMLHSDDKDGASDGRLYLDAYGALATADATALKKSNFEVLFDGSSSVVLPLVLSVSDDLGQLAIEQIDGFINPLPLGTMEVKFVNLGDTFAKMGGKTGFTLQESAEATNSHTVISSQVVQAALPERPSAGNGVPVVSPEGAPVDNDNESALVDPTLNPFFSSAAGAGATTTPSSVTIGSASLFSATPQTNAPSAGFDVSLILPDIEYWQLELTVVLERALGPNCEPDEPVHGPLLFLLRDPTIVVNTVDKVLETIQKGLDAFSDVLSVPIIGDQLREATQFVTDLRRNVVKALSEALSAAIDTYGGLDNALRMYMFDLLTTDANNDFIIQSNEVSANPFLNFLQDYNGDRLITPDDIVVEYVAGTGTPKIDPALAEYLGITQPSMIPAVLPGQRTAWVTSGKNLPNLDSHGDPILHADGTPCYIGDAGDIIIDPSLRHILEDISGAIDSMEATAGDLLGLIQSTGQDKTFFDSLQNIVTFIANKIADGYTYQSLLRDVFGAGVTASVLTDVLTEFVPSSGALAADAAATKAARLSDPNAIVVKASLAELKAAVKEKALHVGTEVALAQSTAIQFRMHLGQTYTPSLDLSFDIGVPGLPLSLELDGGIQLELDWDLFFGFGIDIKDGFYLITNMPGSAGLGEITTYDPVDKGVATGISSNHHDVHIDNLWLVGKPTFTPAVKELSAQLNVFLAPGGGGGPARLNAELFVLNGTLTDNWDGWIKDNDTGIWGTGTDSMGRLSGTQSPTFGRTNTLFDGDTGADGSRTRLQFNLAVDLKDKGLFGISALSGLTNGRLTFSDLRTAKLSDLVKVEWDAKAQVNMHAELGISLGGEGYLPKIMGDFHMTWQASNKNQNVEKIEKFFSSGYDKLFHVGAPNIWMTDIYLDVGTFFTKFLNPIVGMIQDVTDPIMPVIDALTTPIPGLSDLMGRNYSAVDLASDMSSLFGGISQVDFLIAIVNMLDVIDNLPTDTDGMLIPVSQAFVVSGTKDRKLNLAALPSIPGLPNIDVPVDLPYAQLADVEVDQDGFEFSLNMGVGWHEDTTLLNIFQANLPDLAFDFSLNADVKVPAPYIDVTPFNFTIDGLSGSFRLDIKAGWQDLRLSDILSGDFAPRFDVTLVLPDGFDINTQILPVLKVMLPRMTWSIGSHTWVWASGGEFVIDWPDAFSMFVDQGNVKTLDMTGASFDVNLGSISPFLPQVQVKWPTVRWIGLGKEFAWAQTDTTNLGWSSIISDAGLLSALVDPNRTITVEMPDVWLPSISLFDLLPDFNFDFDFGLPGLPSLPDINIDLPDIDMPGQQTVSPKQAFDDFKNGLKKPGSALKFPIIDDPVGSVIAMLMGEPADLVTFTPNNLNLQVGFRVSYPIYPPLYVGLGGSISIDVALTLGFDTYGIGKFFDSHNLTDILDGFYVSDNIVNGVDKPEITLNAKLYAFAELNVFVVRGGVEGGIKLEGTLDIYDENKDGKYRASELIAAVSEDPLDVVEMHLRGSAYIAAYVDINLLFDWVRVWEWTFMDVTLFEWEHDPGAKKPVLGSMDGSILTLHAGSTTGSIDGESTVTKGAIDRKRRSTDDGNESFTLTGSGGTGEISAILTNGLTYTKTFAGVSRVKAFGGAGDDTFDASALDLPVLFIAGGGNDTLTGGSGDDVLIGSDSGTATLIGGSGNDRLIARGGTTTMQGGTGDDTYRFPGDWGTVTVDDTNGNNIFDFTAQTGAINIDDAYFTATRSANTVTWDGTTSIDVIKGGTGADVIDFSGDAANLLVTITDTNKGWVKGSGSGKTQTSFDAATHQDMKDVGDNGGRGFKFEGFENIIGGQGSDVFRMRDGASITGSLHGDTATGAYHDASGNEVANARNTIDFSEYTNSVTLDLERESAFGSAGATTITVRGFHNIFGGLAGDRLFGDGRNNLIVGNNGTDTLEGKSAHDLLVADTFVTYKNLIGAQTRPADADLKNVTDYLTLQTAGAAEFGAASRNWIWKGQTLENKSLSTAGKQTLKGGSGNDIILGALGGDLINVGGSGEGNDTIMADLGKVEVDFSFRSALSATTFGSKGGGGDTIYLGTGSNLVLAGSGRDVITGVDSANSTNIILADNGTVQYKTAEVTVSGQTKLTFAGVAGRSHLLDFIEAPVAETVGLGSDDTINLSSGSAIVLGGAGKDIINFTAASSTG